MNEPHEKIKSALAEQDGNFIHILNALVRQGGRAVQKLLSPLVVANAVISHQPLGGCTADTEGG